MAPAGLLASRRPRLVRVAGGAAQDSGDSDRQIRAASTRSGGVAAGCGDGNGDGRGAAGSTAVGMATAAGFLTSHRPRLVRAAGGAAKDSCDSDRQIRAASAGSGGVAASDGDGDGDGRGPAGSTATGMATAPDPAALKAHPASRRWI
ncbi:uncharacterized protein [Oryza sativa Japonica Group]|uniref:Expressed protein n=3 Tax=Oryza TaxID=4527 RepID=A3BIH1_ORYSJ|nr:glycine-rich protein 1-like [Oryza sativa Japonica Group]AAX96690.1 expressed protein [Oryza sativa Japonica Group]ABA92526.1 expressed protein [Oryza sativa Japonica Group]EAZ39360.1 hypothetical protein OsJ_23789 [Oryza sativa Japonica Group]KAF2910370.1 hypothetical protein DAI22_11g095250 [Oryza sativa Japonica Group]BAG95651.1 unnamed protein product [Oryza sativa Japonica Group]|eukprot:NP_001176467.1 Os11g0258900 [Oryza sativa Japonica Group]